jgi:hypothetical protein
VTRILDNLNAELGEHLQRTFKDFDRMDIAVGYFNLRGWNFFDSLIHDKVPVAGQPIVRILIGMAAA